MLVGTRGLTVWLTGLTGSGKSTSAAFLLDELRGRGVTAVSLDGDAIRKGISADLGYAESDRTENVRRTGEVALLLASQGVVVVASLVSPRRASRDEVRRRHDGLGIGFVEVHVAAPLEVCEERDVTTLYRRARDGSVTHLAGVDDPYEAPLHPEVVLATDRKPPAETGAELVDAVLRALGAIRE